MTMTGGISGANFQEAVFNKKFEDFKKQDDLQAEVNFYGKKISEAFSDEFKAKEQKELHEDAKLENIENLAAISSQMKSLELSIIAVDSQIELAKQNGDEEKVETLEQRKSDMQDKLDGFKEEAEKLKNLNTDFDSHIAEAKQNIEEADKRIDDFSAKERDAQERLDEYNKMIDSKYSEEEQSALKTSKEINETHLNNLKRENQEQIDKRKKSGGTWG